MKNNNNNQVNNQNRCYCPKQVKPFGFVKHTNFNFNKYGIVNFIYKFRENKIIEYLGIKFGILRLIPCRSQSVFNNKT